MANKRSASSIVVEIMARIMIITVIAIPVIAIISTICLAYFSVTGNTDMITATVPVFVLATIAAVLELFAGCLMLFK